MQGEDAKTWQALCAKAAVEQDPNKLLELVTEINLLLEKKAKRLKAAHTAQNERPSPDSEV